MCGNNQFLPPDSSKECDPTDHPCCDHESKNVRCDNNHHSCTCEGCVDYRVVQDLRASKSNCTITRVGDFLKTVCSDVENKTKYYFRCINSEVSYESHTPDQGVTKVSKVCENDNYAYQSCLHRSQISKKVQIWRCFVWWLPLR